MEILTDIPVDFDLDDILQKLYIDKDSEHAKVLAEMIEKVKGVASPKAIFDVYNVRSIGNNTVISREIFASEFLRINLDGIDRAFLYVATCGKDLDGIETKTPFELYLLGELKTIALDASVKLLSDCIGNKYDIGEMPAMNPGSCDVHKWPIEQQKKLFSILGNVEGSIGVTLKDNSQLIPDKSVFGIYFPRE